MSPQVWGCFLALKTGQQKIQPLASLGLDSHLSLPTTLLGVPSKIRRSGAFGKSCDQKRQEPCQEAPFLKSHQVATSWLSLKLPVPGARTPGCLQERWFPWGVFGGNGAIPAAKRGPPRGGRESQSKGLLSSGPVSTDPVLSSRQCWFPLEGGGETNLSLG